MYRANVRFPLFVQKQAPTPKQFINKQNKQTNKKQQQQLNKTTKQTNITNSTFLWSTTTTNLYKFAPYQNLLR